MRPFPAVCGGIVVLRIAGRQRGRSEIDVALDTDRGTVLRHVALRISADAVLELHLDTDEANAAGLRGTGEGVLQRCGCCAHIESADESQERKRNAASAR